MKRLLILPLFTLLCMQACKKDDPADNEPDPPTIDKPADYFFPMKLGNYWVYETINSENSSVMIDTVKIISDTLIAGEQFFLFNELNPFVFGGGYWTWVADSSGHLIDTLGVAYKINDGSRDTLGREDFGFVNTVIKNGTADTAINVPAGSFSCLETVTDVYYPGNNSPTNINPRYLHEYWSKNIGMVKRTYFFASDARFYTVTLKSYHLEP